jgi:hypothetical protein
MSRTLRQFGVRWTRWCCLLLLIVSLSGCTRDTYLKLFGYDRASLLKKFTPPDDESLAIQYVDLLRQRGFDQIEDRLDPSIKNAETHDALAEMWGMIPAGEPSSVKTVDSHVVHGKDGSTTSITLEYEFAPRALPTSGSTESMARSWLLAGVVIQTRGGVKTISGFHVMPIPRSFEEANEFSLLDKGFSQYAGLCVAVGVSVFTLYVFVLCKRTRTGRQEWLWLVPILIGVFRVTVNWTSGEWSFTPLAIQAPPVMTLSSPYGPWMIQVTIPLGAIVFLLLRRDRTSDIVASPLMQSPTSGLGDPPTHA